MKPPEIQITEIETAPRAQEGATSTTSTNPRCMTLAEAMRAAYPTFLRRAQGKDRAIPTPWEGVNERLRGGWWPGLYTLTSATGMGKTQWALHAALHAAAWLKSSWAKTTREAPSEAPPEPARVRYIALELGRDDIAARAAALLEGAMRWSDIAYGRLAPDELALLWESNLAIVEQLPFDLEIAPAMGWTWRDLAAIGAKNPPRMVVLDYSQLARAPEGVREELRETLSSVAKIARDLARNHEMTFLALCSTARANYDKVSGRKDDLTPGANDADATEYIDLGKESGDLEFTADGVLALVRDPADQASVWVAAAKGRGFPPGWCRPALDWNGSIFTESQREPAAATARTKARKTR